MTVARTLKIAGSVVTLVGLASAVLAVGWFAFAVDDRSKENQTRGNNHELRLRKINSTLDILTDIHRKQLEEEMEQQRIYRDLCKQGKLSQAYCEVQDYPYGIQ